MVNKAVAEQGLKIQAEREKAKKEREERDSTEKVYIKHPKPFELFIPKSEKEEAAKEGRPAKSRPFFISFLHDHRKGLGVYVHINKIWKEQERKFETHRIICNKTYEAVDPTFSSCPWCPTKEDYKKNFKDPTKKKASTYFKLYIGYVHNFEGEMFTPPGSDESFPISPVRLIEIRAGESKINHLKLVEHQGYGWFLKKLFVMRKYGTGIDTSYPPLEPFDRNEEWFAEEIGEAVVPEEVLDEWMNRSEDEVAQQILLSYENVNWELWGVEAPVQSDTESSDEEETTPKPRSKKALA